MGAKVLRCLGNVRGSAVPGTIPGAGPEECRRAIGVSDRDGAADQGRRAESNLDLRRQKLVNLYFRDASAMKRRLESRYLTL